MDRDDLNLSGSVTVVLDQPAREAPSSPDPAADREKEAEKEAKEGRISAATTLATGVAVLASALGLFGGLTGAVARMARNYPDASTVAILSVVVSVALAISARLLAPGNGKRKALEVLPRSLLPAERQPYWSTVLLWVSVLLFVFGLGLAIRLLAQTIDKDDRPSVSAQATRDAKGVVSVAGTAKASGLAAEEALRVVVVALPKGETEEGTQVYYAEVGSNADGVVDQSFTVLLPTGTRSVVITAGNSADDAVSGCEPEGSVDDPVKAADPVVVSSKDDALTACALVAVPKQPPSTSTSASSDAEPPGD